MQPFHAEDVATNASVLVPDSQTVLFHSRIQFQTQVGNQMIADADNLRVSLVAAISAFVSPEYGASPIALSKNCMRFG